MDKSKIKNYIIFLLAFMNASLLIIVLGNMREASRAQSYREETIISVLAKNGISVSEDVSFSTPVLEEKHLRRDLGSERRGINALLGYTMVEYQGGSIYHYSGSGGRASFSGSGEFEILLNPGVIAKGADLVSSAQSALRMLGIRSSAACPVVIEEGENTIVVLTSAFGNVEIYNALLRFEFNSDYLERITGRRPLDIVYASHRLTRYVDGVTALMNFLQSIHESGDICSEIRSLNLGYFLSNEVSGKFILRPVWRVETDTGIFYIDKSSGRFAGRQAGLRG